MGALRAITLVLIQETMPATTIWFCSRMERMLLHSPTIKASSLQRKRTTAISLHNPGMATVHPLVGRLRLRTVSLGLDHASVLYSNNYAPGPPNGGPHAGQRAGLQVTECPGGAALQVRIDRGLDSNHVQPGTPFTGIVMNDIVANGSIAIPRGASIQGTVVDAKKAGTLKGRGELSLQLTSLTLGGQTYPLATNPWGEAGRDKTTGTVNSAIGLGALGAIVGAVAGGGAGAAIGAGVGGAAGVASSAASPNGRVIVPPESVLTFTLAQPTTVTTVSQQEMARLSYAAGPAPVRYGPGPYPYYGPVYYRPY